MHPRRQFCGSTPRRTRATAAYEEACFFLVRFTLSRFSTCNSVCDDSMICHRDTHTRPCQHMLRPPTVRVAPRDAAATQDERARIIIHHLRRTRRPPRTFEYAASVSWMVLSYSFLEVILRARLSLMRASRSVRIRKSFWIFAASHRRTPDARVHVREQALLFCAARRRRPAAAMQPQLAVVAGGSVQVCSLA